ncbi:MAG: hypothetical protein A2X36_06160 [Elusimicrobia bacterium GWA2_69_24]|nr:MAG: hypothetical protein A2X36_06160 [Elusimicrobia bacterium GWA2_69_24]HBL18214.1 site-2 protease family protein [Elusimicrobiota bacterium]
MEWIIQLPVLFFSVVVHEFCHGWAAFVRGDDTAERAGRLTLNPMAHVDPFGTVFVPLLCLLTSSPVFGWARPVPVNPRRFKDPVRDMVRVALMGPLSNFALALAAAFLFKGMTFVPGSGPGLRQTLLELLLFGVTLNFFLAFFNLLPVHPLDGSKVLSGLLPVRWRDVYERHAPYGMVIILLLLFTHNLAPLVLWPMRISMALLMQVGILG